LKGHGEVQRRKQRSEVSSRERQSFPEKQSKENIVKGLIGQLSEDQKK
jgi:hypothetical protein